VRFSEVAARVDGVSTPFFGALGRLPRVDVDVARRFVTFAAARTVLDLLQRGAEECVQSVLAIRGFLSDALGAGAIADELVEPLRLMRRYSVRFLERVGAIEDRHDPQASSRHLFREHRRRMQD
jgi:hypothetical protein